MVLLILGCVWQSVVGIIIYIPLWFYLYHGQILQQARHMTFTFHYGSTYIISIYMVYLRLIFIYIPLWFYLYYSRFPSCVWDKNIYIPLWFYLYPSLYLSLTISTVKLDFVDPLLKIIFTLFLLLILNNFCQNSHILSYLSTS